MRAALSIMLTVFLLAGCGTPNHNASPSPRNKTNGTTVNNVNNMNGNRGYTTNNVDGTTPDNTNSGRVGNVNDNNGKVDTTTANHLKSLAESVPGVKNANCVVMGKTAVVGLNVDGDLDRAEVGSIKYTVAEALQKDPAGANALVTADLDVSNRIAELGRHIQQGHPVSGVASELADIVGRIIPQLPKDVTPRDGSAEDVGAQTVKPNNHHAPAKHQHKK
ncbi:sporulation lipoprotein, YhcN/YlaJ family [Paenibacillus vortex V453]|uniref:Sporulation protein n=2 Tax=Paenibacillus TaxID=44249 RepID=A0A163L0E3_9BACL|nr:MULTISPECIES: YhcN/YlaJ family sporulation lipoprotein [Paenibacillus]AWP28866.1 sporulation protein [Paenibacillus sp. Cedars]EFU42083.1 sporulation lipoprotein, YhcN/YlaJ family [Paenibacillus vortex V453]KZS47700.1 sporulation protein [Paenibacillus glucanolyticus]